MQWLNLDAYGLRLSVGRMPGSEQAATRITGSPTALSGHRHVLRRLGYEAGRDGRTWWRATDRMDSGAWAELRRAFPDAIAVDVDAFEVFDTGRHRQMSYVTVGEHRGAPRIWMEGLRLDACGFVPGARYTITFDINERRMMLALDPEGDRVVSRRKRKRGGEVQELPIIDIASMTLTDVLGEAGRVRAALYAGRIEIDLHPVDRAVMEREARTRANVADGAVTEGTLCAGAGVSTLAMRDGLEAAGLDTTVEWIVDRERSYLQVAADNNPAAMQTVLYEAALEEVDGALMQPVDIVQVSLPCTGHSASGKAKRGLRRAEDHPTDALAVFGLIRILDAVQPSVVVSENVTQARDSATYHLLQTYLREQGYVIADCVLDGEHAGTIEQRDRWWFVAISRGFADGFTLDALPQAPRRYGRLGDALEPIADDDPAWTRHDYLDSKAVKDRQAGKGFARQLVGPDAVAVGTIGRGYAKRRSTEPFLVRGDGLERLLTPVEHARVKGVPEALVRDLSATLAHEVLGQSILYPHASMLAERIGRHLREVVGGRAVAGSVESTVTVPEHGATIMAR